MKPPSWCWESSLTATLPPSSYLHKIEHAVAGFAVPLPHHVCPSPPLQLPAALMLTKYVFVCGEYSVPSLAPLYQGSYLLLKRQTKFFCLQLGSMDRLKPVVSVDPESTALPPTCGLPAIRPALRAPGPSSSPP